MPEVTSLFSAASETQEIFNVIMFFSIMMFKNSLKMKTLSIYKNSWKVNAAEM